MKRLVLVFAMVAASVFLAQPAVADGEAEPDTATVTTESSPPAAEEAPAPAEEPSAPVVEEPSTPAVEEPSAPPASESAKQAPAALVVAPADTTGDEATGPEEVVAEGAAVKVWICKYVGQPGVDERLKEGKQPINTNSNSLPGMPVNPQVGDEFVDAHGRSEVVQVGGSDPGNGACEAGVLSTEVTTAAPVVSPATCDEDGALTLPNTPGVLYTLDPNPYAGPGTYDVTASALDGYVLSGDSVTAWNDLVVEEQDDPQNCITSENPKKVWVCKYVGKPGVDEVLKGGKNPIFVNENSLPGSPVNVQVGDDFSDAQERSHVIALEGDPEPTVDDCLPAIEPLGQVQADPPTADPATCEADGSLNVPETDHVVYTVEPDTTGPGDYVITADEADETVELIGQTEFNITVDAKLPVSDCVLGEEEVAGEDDALLPDTGGVPLGLLLIGGLLAVAGVAVLRGGTRSLD